MTKHRIRSIMTGFCVFILAGIIYLLYTDTSTPDLQPVAERDTYAEEADVSDNIPTSSGQSIYYIARIEGNSLAIYMCGSNGEEFMYNLNVRLEDISEHEYAQLVNGIILNSPAELASFEEDFTG